MFGKQYSETIINTRPLVFLCGPYAENTDDLDRRNILRKHFNGFSESITCKGEIIEINPFALVVDNLFDLAEVIDKRRITLIEEIIAACAYKNYIFMDTMSTSLELGLFSNCFADNVVTVFLPKDYQWYKPAIGEFVMETINKSTSIKVCTYQIKDII